MPRRSALGSGEPKSRRGVQSCFSVVASRDASCGSDAVQRNPTDIKILKLIPAGIELRPTASRVLNRPFIPTGPGRVRGIIDRILALSEMDVESQLDQLRSELGPRH